jgi:hypothetical protein
MNLKRGTTMKTTNTDITRVTYRWDDQDGVGAGWYCQSFAGCVFVDDSQKVWYPVSVDDYAEQAELVASLKKVFPNAEIVKG